MCSSTEIPLQTDQYAVDRENLAHVSPHEDISRLNGATVAMVTEMSVKPLSKSVRKNLANQLY